MQVTAKKNLEGERALQMERQKATLAIENLGSKEMSLKGIGNVEEGVKKITGISIASAGQLIVRGLGDRYSTTTLNGLPIALAQPRQQAGAARPVPLVHRTEHHRQQSV